MVGEGILGRRPVVIVAEHTREAVPPAVLRPEEEILTIPMSTA